MSGRATDLMILALVNGERVTACLMGLAGVCFAYVWFARDKRKS